ncbi:cadherin-1-like [Hippoglossus stenolepis]|uniref:cadherin-1-like n=1 Tax=Hippoglossus stenolepis TaxID=195615 RepID=UPI001FAF35D0|nr:cadherin-1-like [Hippoglossus stenolepis]
MIYEQMAPTRFMAVGILLIVFQASALETTQEPKCVPGFKSDVLIFRVTRKHLGPGTRLGRVGFNDCTNRTRFLFISNDRRFMVHPDGILMVKRMVALLEGHQDFFIHSWNLHCPKMTVTVVHYGRLHGQNDGHHHGHHRGENHGHHQQNVEHHLGEHRHHNNQHHLNEVDSANNTENATTPEVPVLNFPKSGDGLRRRKRDWVVPDINVPENLRGPYPLKVSQIRSNEDGVKTIYYSITGPGADEPPLGLFTMDRLTGTLYVTQPLDREKVGRYTTSDHQRAPPAVPGGLISAALRADGGRNTDTWRRATGRLTHRN